MVIEAMSMDNTKEYLKKLSFFAELSNSLLDEIAKLVIQRNYRKNMIIFMEGEPGEAVFFIEKGRVKVFRTSEDGREIIINIFGPGEVFAEVTLLNPGSTYPVTAQTIEDSVIYFIRNQDFENLLRRNTELSLEILKILSQRLRYLQSRIKNLAFNDTYVRTAQALIKFAQQYGVQTEEGIKLDLPITRKELSDVIGTSRETVSRALSQFAREGAINTGGRAIVIKDINKLKKWVE